MDNHSDLRVAAPPEPNRGSHPTHQRDAFHFTPDSRAAARAEMAASLETADPVALGVAIVQYAERCPNDALIVALRLALEQVRLRRQHRADMARAGNAISKEMHHRRGSWRHGDVVEPAFRYGGHPVEAWIDEDGTVHGGTPPRKGARPVTCEHVRAGVCSRCATAWVRARREMRGAA